VPLSRTQLAGKILAAVLMAAAEVILREITKKRR
jgi:hypothetical protein